MKALLALCLLLATPLRAGEVTDILMAPALFTDAPLGELARYKLERHVPQDETADAEEEEKPARDFVVPKADFSGELALFSEENGETRHLTLRIYEGEASRDIANFSPMNANPVLLYFLENVVRNVAAQTGGSPYYIKNRIRDSLVAADFSDAGEVELQPFAKDPNAAKLGPYADLRLSISFDPETPARLFELKADTALGADGYTEHLTLQPEP